MPINPDQYAVIDGTDTEPRQIRPQHPLTEWTGRALLEGILGISGSGAIIPQYDFVDVSDRYGATNNVRTVVFKNGATQVAHWTLTYINGAIANDDDLATATLVIP